MLIYYEVEHEDSPAAQIHNVETGITYQLSSEESRDGQERPVITMRAPNDNRLFPPPIIAGGPAITFWRALLSMNPRAENPLRPHDYLRQLVREYGLAEPAEAESDIPF